VGSLLERLGRERETTRYCQTRADDRTARPDDRAVATARQAVASSSSPPADQQSVHTDGDPHRRSHGTHLRHSRMCRERTRDLPTTIAGRAKRTEHVHRSPHAQAEAHGESAPIERRLCTCKSKFVQHRRRDVQLEPASCTHEFRIDPSQSRIDQHEPTHCRRGREIMQIDQPQRTSRSIHHTRWSPKPGMNDQAIGHQRTNRSHPEIDDVHPISDHRAAVSAPHTSNPEAMHSFKSSNRTAMATLAIAHPCTEK
jgi:hypothetical protein